LILCMCISDCSNDDESTTISMGSQSAAVYSSRIFFTFDHIYLKPLVPNYGAQNIIIFNGSTRLDSRNQA
jgi:hypothetical protein